MDADEDIEVERASGRGKKGTVAQAQADAGREREKYRIREAAARRLQDVTNSFGTRAALLLSTQTFLVFCSRNFKAKFY